MNEQYWAKFYGPLYWRTPNFNGVQCSWLLRGSKPAVVNDYGDLWPMPSMSWAVWSRPYIPRFE